MLVVAKPQARGDPHSQFGATLKLQGCVSQIQGRKIYCRFIAGTEGPQSLAFPHLLPSHLPFQVSNIQLPVHWQSQTCLFLEDGPSEEGRRPQVQKRHASQWDFPVRITAAFIPHAPHPQTISAHTSMVRWARSVLTPPPTHSASVSP